MPEENVCGQLKTSFTELLQKKEGLNNAFDQGVKVKQLDRAIQLKKEIGDIIGALNEVLEPNHVELRKRLAEQFGFSFVHNFVEGFARAKKDNGWYFIKPTGETINENEGFMDAKDFSEGRALVRKMDGKWYFIKPTGETINENEGFVDARDFSEGLAYVHRADDNKWCHVDKKGRVVFKDK